MMLLWLGSLLRSLLRSRIPMRSFLGRLLRAVLLWNWLRLVLLLRWLLWLGWLRLGLLLRPPCSMALQRNLCRTGCTSHKITMHVLVDGNIRGRLRDRKLALEGCTGRILGIPIGRRRLPFNHLLTLNGLVCVKNTTREERTCWWLMESKFFVMYELKSLRKSVH